MKFKLLFLLLATFYLLPTVAAAATLSKPPNNLGLVGYWSMDEGTSTKVHDVSGNGRIGTLAGTLPTWASGKYAKALQFSNGTVTFPAGTLTGTSTISFWASPAASNSGSVLGSRGPGAFGFDIKFQNGNQLHGDIGDGSGWLTTGADATFPFKTGTWYHIVYVITNIGFTIYANGTSIGSGTYSGTPVIYDSTHSLVLGNFGPGGAEPYSGKLDDVRIYSRALTAAQVTALYTQGEAKVNTSGAALNNGTTLGKGLVGYWTFDGGAINWVTNKAYDLSGQNNTGTLVSMPTSTSGVIGKLGQALKFNGSSYIDVGNPSSLNIVGAVSVCSWFTVRAYTSTFQALVTKGDTTYRLARAGTNGISFAIGAGTTVTSNTNVTGGKWFHACGTFTGGTGGTLSIYVNGALENTTTGNDWSTNGNSFAIGENLGNPARQWNGNIDDVRVYNRALSAAEVKQLYNVGSTTANTSSRTLQNGTSLSRGLVSLWSFDGKDVTDKVYDRIGGNNGYFYNGATSSAKAIGKLGQALNFNGSGFYVRVPSSSSLQSFSSSTFCAWAKTPAISDVNGTTIIAKPFTESATPTSPYELYSLGINQSPRTVAFFLSTNTTRVMLNSASTVPVNSWAHICGTHDGTTMRIYINGVQDANTAAFTGPIGSNSVDVRFGAFLSQTVTAYQSGPMDDIRIYNRALSAAEIKALYNVGK